MDVFATREFAKFAAKEGISDEELCEAVARADRGLVDANLAGALIKQRVARAGQGRSRGYRTILVYRETELAVFVHGFRKSDRANLGKQEQEAFAKFGRNVIALSSSSLSELETRRKWRRLDCEQFQEKVPE